MSKRVSILLVAVLLANYTAVKPSSATEENRAFLANNINSIASTPINIAQAIEPRVIKLRLADSGVSVGSVLSWGFAGLIQKRSTDWVRLELTDNQVKVVHTTRTTNWLTQVSKWWDHPVRKIAFKPDTCKVDSVSNQGGSDIETQLREIKRLYDSKLITEQQYQDLQRKVINQISTTPNQNTTSNSECVLLGENATVQLQNISLLTKGEFKIEYLEGNEWKYAAFRVPEKEYK
ncbi:MAG: hypothetical protein RMZ41_018310 [Nostoc sp. DedVER02]|uniref:hypothetical protein n=1 Tax=unclassified Nostoc TaxID=2593658 RepID=UPI002AD383AC|nr:MULTISPECIES: hypothetical protein [unclassified Nostoc]MDZ7988895.1 hypothetical protein [Nostoc sp. DedVER02]MDZ8112508.1 hypothetical protein [Nostoc sp. DedVER01b]